jgi:hypothetical protein
MPDRHPTPFALVEAPAAGACLSCGAPRSARRLYCSPACRQRLAHMLEIRTGLLRAINARYATFRFTASLLIMEVLPYGSRQIHRYLYPRLSGGTPADDFSRMANALGNLWWRAKRRTRKHYLASRHLLEHAERGGALPERIIPPATRSPLHIARHLRCMGLGRGELEAPDLRARIKGAFRQQAKRCHPDAGGRADRFRRLLLAFEALQQWAEAPRFTTRRGFPDRWFYDGECNRWFGPVSGRRGIR